MSVYADTSFLVSLYTRDAHSVVAAGAMSKADLPLFLSPFSELELTNAVQLRFFRKELTRSQISQAFTLIHHDIASGVYFLKPLPATAFGRALQLSRKRTPRLGTRTLDILHVASALEFRAKTFYTFDRRQGALAKACGLTVHP